MAKKSPAKPAAKRKPRAKKPVQPDLPDGKYNAVVWNPELEMYVVTPLPRDAEKTVIDQTIKEAETHLVKPAVKSSGLWRRLMLVGAVVAGLVVSFGGGVWSAGGWDISPKPVVRNDVLQQSYDADRVSQAKILREYAAQGFKNDDAGRQAATKWFNDNRFRNRGDDFRPYTSAVTGHFAAGTIAKFADELEGK